MKKDSDNKAPGESNNVGMGGMSEKAGMKGAMSDSTGNSGSMREAVKHLKKHHGAAHHMVGKHKCS